MTIPKIVTRVVRFAAGDPPPAADNSPAVDETAAKVSLKDYAYVADFTPHAAEPLLQRFKRAGIRFEIGCDITPPAENAVNGGCYAERRTISVYVRQDDLAKAREISPKDVE